MDVSPEDYAEGNSIQFKHSNELIDRIIEENDEIQFSNIIDIGCGCGNVTYNLLKRIKPQSLLGIDKDPEMIEYAVNHYSAPQIHYEIQDFGVPFHRMNNSLKELSGKTPLIFTNECLHWINDAETAAKNIAQLLSDNGKLYANISMTFTSNKWISDIRNKFAINVHIASLEEQSERWRNALKSAGMSIINENIIETPILYTNDYLRKVIIPISAKLLLKCIIEDDPKKREDIYNRYKHFCEANCEKVFNQSLNSGPNGEILYEDKEVVYQIVAEKYKS